MVQLRKCYLFSCRYKNARDIGIFQTAFSQGMSITSKRYDRPFLTSGNKPQSSFICKFEGRGNRRTHCTKCWSNLTLKCNVNTFVKTDAQIREECRRTISYLQGYSCPKLYCKKLSNQKPTVNAVPNTRRTTLC